MRYKAEIFDRFQYLYRTTGFNDHQLHCVIEFENKLNVKTLEAAIRWLLKTAPILTGVYKDPDKAAYWEASEIKSISEVFTIVRSQKAFDEFTFSKTEEEVGPQIKLCLYSAEQDSLAIVMNHMITDGAGMKQCAYQLAELYSKLLQNPEYRPKPMVMGDRSFKKITAQFPFKERLKVLLRNNNDNNQPINCSFPMSKGKDVAPFILTHRPDEETFLKILGYCKKNKVTVNDFMLTAYFRVLSELLIMNGKKFNLPIMIDMRRYLKDKQNLSLTNLSSTVILTMQIEEDEKFEVTLNKLSKQMKAKKDNYLGLNTFLKLQTVFKLFGEQLGYRLLRKSLKNPAICMTNIGIIDDCRLVFKNCPVKDAFVCGSIKYRPHFQMAVSSFKNSMTLSVNLYGDAEDQKNIRKFFKAMDQELEQALS